MALKEERSNKATAKTPADRFEKVENPNRVGVHRAGEQIGSTKTKWLFIFLTSLLLATVGIIFVQMQPGKETYSQTEPANEEVSKPSKVVGVIDPDATVAVLNGTEIDDLSYFVDDQIATNNWGQMVFSGQANTNDVRTSAIFYSDPDDEVAALGLGEKLGGIKAYQDEGYVTFDNQLTVLLGEDYQGPGLDEAIESTHPRVGESEFEDEGFVDEEFVDEQFVEEGVVDDGFVDEGVVDQGLVDQGFVDQGAVVEDVVDPLSEGQ